MYLLRGPETPGVRTALRGEKGRGEARQRCSGGFTAVRSPEGSVPAHSCTEEPREDEEVAPGSRETTAVQRKRVEDHGIWGPLTCRGVPSRTSPSLVTCASCCPSPTPHRGGPPLHRGPHHLLSGPGPPSPSASGHTSLWSPKPPLPGPPAPRLSPALPTPAADLCLLTPM